MRTKRIILLSYAIIGFVFSFGCGYNSELPDWQTGEEDQVDSPTPRPTAAPEGMYIVITSPKEETTFLSTDKISLTAAIFNNDNDPRNTIDWLILGFYVDNEDENYYYYDTNNVIEFQNISGITVSFTPSLSPAAIGRGKKILYEIHVQLNKGSLNIVADSFLVQDCIDQCRQEYIDIRRNGVAISGGIPTRDVFSNKIHSTHFTHEELKGNSYYNYIIIRTELLAGMENIRHCIDPTDQTAMTVSSCYRNPAFNETLKYRGSALNSKHLYGKAVDILINKDFSGNGTFDEEEDWNYMKDKAHLEGACVEPADYNNRKPRYDYIHMHWQNDPCPNNW